VYQELLGRHHMGLLPAEPHDDDSENELGRYSSDEDQQPGERYDVGCGEGYGAGEGYFLGHEEDDEAEEDGGDEDEV
jgi:hypothetical protein